MLGPLDARIQSHWEYIHDRKLCEDIARMQDLDAAIALEDKEKRKAARRKRHLQMTPEQKRKYHQPKNEAGNRYGLLTVIAEYTESLPHGGVFWLCRCDCGRERVVRGVELRRGDARCCSRLRHPERRKRKE